MLKNLFKMLFVFTFALIENFVYSKLIKTS